MKKFAYAFALCLAGAALCAAALLAEDTPPAQPAAPKGRESRELRITSYNIRHCCGADNKVSCQRIAEMIKHERPVLVGLQEVDNGVKRSGRKNQAEELGKLAGLHATFAKAVPLQGGEYGNAILSREAPSRTYRVSLPGSEPRTLLICEFTNCWFGTMHLDLKPDKQMESVEKIQKVVQRFSATKPVFLTGDWNATPDSPTLKALRKFMTVVSEERCRTFHGFKKNKSGERYCIDYIAVDSAHAQTLSVNGSRVRKNAIPSDHYPITSIIELPAE